MPRRIIHCTNVHRWDDVRIFHKMARSTAAAGFDTHVVAIDRDATAASQFVRDGATVHLLPGTDIRSRAKRALAGGNRVAAMAASLDGDIVHIHDPELLPFLVTRRFGRAKRIFDAHEDLSGQVQSKPWIPAAAQPIFGLIARSLEAAAGRADALLAATPFIAAKLGHGALAIQNFPLLSEFPPAQGRSRSPASIGLYAGGITRTRGILQMIEAVGLCEAVRRVHLAGTFESEAMLAEARALRGWTKVEYHGFLPREKLVPLFAEADFGLLTLLPEPNYVNSQPTKLFEYMSAGLPVVASDFPRWRELIGDDSIAEFVDPANPRSIAAGIDRLLRRLEGDRAAIAATARRLVEDRFSWDAEFKKLKTLYERLLA
ncbi:MAG TPA: glycosyltransferase family 4 protein [Rhizobiaceae bacterium]|nr:glycosyltransferase family 4 protein [Rhizobiaceae bacterium]